MTSAPAPPAPDDAGTAGLIPRCPTHGNPLHGWDGTRGRCHRTSRAGHEVTAPEWGPPPPAGHLRGGPGKAMGPGHAPTGRGFPPIYGPVRKLRFRADQERYAERMAAATKGDRSAALRDLLRRGLRELDNGAALPDDGGRESVAGQPLRTIQYWPDDDARVETMRAPAGGPRRQRNALHRQLLDLGIAQRKRTHR